MTTFLSLLNDSRFLSLLKGGKKADNWTTDAFKKINYLDDSGARLVGGGDDGLALRRDSLHLPGACQGILQLQHLLL